MAKKFSDYSEEQSSRRWNDNIEESESESEISTFVEENSEVIDIEENQDDKENKKESDVLISDSEIKKGNSNKNVLLGLVAALGVGAVGYLGYNFANEENVDNQSVQTQSQVSDNSQSQALEEAKQQVQVEQSKDFEDVKDQKQEFVENDVKTKNNDFESSSSKLSSSSLNQNDDFNNPVKEPVEAVKEPMLVQQEVKEVKQIEAQAQVPTLNQPLEQEQVVNNVKENVEEQQSNVQDQQNQNTATDSVVEQKDLIKEADESIKNDLVMQEEVRKPFVENDVKENVENQAQTQTQNVNTYYANEDIKNELKQISNSLDALKLDINKTFDEINKRDNEQDVKINDIQQKSENVKSLSEQNKNEIVSLREEIEQLKSKIISLEEKGASCNTVCNVDKKSYVNTQKAKVKPRAKTPSSISGNSVQLIGKPQNIDAINEVSTVKEARTSSNRVATSRTTNANLGKYRIMSILNGIAWISDNKGKTTTYTQGDYLAGKQIGSIDVDSGIYDLEGNKLLDVK